MNTKFTFLAGRYFKLSAITLWPETTLFALQLDISFSLWLVKAILSDGSQMKSTFLLNFFHSPFFLKMSPKNYSLRATRGLKTFLFLRKEIYSWLLDCYGKLIISVGQLNIVVSLFGELFCKPSYYILQTNLQYFTQNNLYRIE